MQCNEEIVILSPQVRADRACDSSSMEQCTTFLQKKYGPYTLVVTTDYINEIYRSNIYLNIIGRLVKSTLVKYWLATLGLACKKGIKLVCASQEYILPYYFAKQTCIVHDTIQYYRPRSIAYLLFYRYYLKTIIPRLHSVSCVSKTTERFASRVWNINRFQPILGIYTSMMNEKDGDCQTSACDNGTNILWIGTISPHKRLSMFLEGIRHLKLSAVSSSLVINIVVPMSDYKLATKVVNKALQGKEGVQFSVYHSLNPIELSKLYEISTIYVCTSIIEGYCLPLREAHCHGCMCIAPNRSIFREMHRKYSYLFPPYSREGLTDAMQYCIDFQKNQRAML